jgi:FkbM family methyltransferase
MQASPSVWARLGGRKRVFANPVLRFLARCAVHAGMARLTSVADSYRGTFQVRLAGFPVKYQLREHDYIGEILFWKGPQFESAIIGVFSEYAKDARGVLDIGANTGLYSLLACAANREAKVKAWEPVPYLYNALRANLAANGFDGRCEARCAAASQAAGTATLYVPVASTTMASLRSDHNADKTTAIPVTIETIDEAIGSDFPVDLIKIDVEGHEHEVLLGMRETLASFHPAIVFECLPSTPPGPIEELLFGHGYGLWQLFDSGPRRKLRDSAPLRIERLDPSHSEGEYNYLALHPLGFAKGRSSR